MLFSKTKTLGIIVTLLAVSGTLLSNVVAKNEREELKAELLTELLNATKES